MVFGSLLTEIWTKVLWDLGNIVSSISQPIMNQTTCIVVRWNQEVKGFNMQCPAVNIKRYLPLDTRNKPPVVNIT